MYIKKSIIKINNFICIGAIHLDNILMLKNRYYKSVLHDYLSHNNYPFKEGEKIGF